MSEELKLDFDTSLDAELVYLRREIKDIRAKLELAKEAKEAIKRCYIFITALHIEMMKLQDIDNVNKAYALGQMKINLTGYLLSIWPDKSSLDNDLELIEALQKLVDK